MGLLFRWGKSTTARLEHGTSEQQFDRYQYPKTSQEAFLSTFNLKKAFWTIFDVLIPLCDCWLRIQDAELTSVCKDAKLPTKIRYYWNWTQNLLIMRLLRYSKTSQEYFLVYILSEESFLNIYWCFYSTVWLLAADSRRRIDFGLRGCSILTTIQGMFG